MKYIGLIARWIFILCIPVMLLTASIAWAANSLWLYEYSFGEYGVSADTGISDEQLERAARELISYFNSGEELVDISVEKDGEVMTGKKVVEVEELIRRTVA